MTKSLVPQWIRATVLGWLLAALCLPSFGQDTTLSDDSESVREGAWVRTSKDGYWLNSRVITLAPKPEAKPALRYELMPQPFHMVEGNAALDYLAAIGFPEQNAAREAMLQFEREGWKKVEGTDREPEPFIWMEMLPSELPVSRVKQYLSYTSWQRPYLKRAFQRERCDFDRNIRAVENPSAYLLPEIQMMRGLARTQSIRFRLAIHENNPSEAFEIFGQQLAIARHLDQDLFLVTNLVGIACASIGVNDAYFLSEHPDAPNMYWALTALPRPLVSMKSSLSYERDFAFEEFKQLKLVDEEPLPAGYWKRIVDELSVAINKTYLGINPGDEKISKIQLASMIAASYPNARAFLLNETSMTAEKIDSLPNTQVVLLGIRRMHEFLRDEFFKLHYLRSYEKSKLDSPSDVLEKATAEYGLLTSMSGLLLPALEAVANASDRLDSQICMLRIVESMRDHLTQHDQLPMSLDELRLPAPEDPRTGKPFAYKLQDGKGILTSSIIAGYQLRLILEPPQ